ncbi:MAG: FecR domain-containing protein [Nitrospiraceae bacterium]|nr:FecR domain-containing protein [Nitrospiraceae bacterium]
MHSHHTSFFLSARLYVALAAVALLSGLLPVSAPAASPGNDQVLAITVKPGDTLNDLCKEFLKDPEQCSEIAAFNRIKNPDRIEPGERILIPVSYLRFPPLTGAVTFIKGDVLVQSEGIASWRLIAQGDTVRSGDKIRTGRDGSVELAFDDGSTYLLRPGTDLDISLLERRESTGFLKRLFLGIGKLVAKTAKQAGVASRTELRTQTAIAGVRGTRFDLMVADDRTTRAAVQEGSISVSSMGKEVTVGAGEGTMVKQDMPPQEPRKLLAAPSAVGQLPVYASLPVSLQISSVQGAVSYHALLSRDTEGKDIVMESMLEPGAAFQARELANGVYYLFLRSVDDQGMEGMEAAPSVIEVRVEEQPAASPAPLVPPAPPAAPPATTGPGAFETAVTVLFIVGAILF